MKRGSTRKKSSTLVNFWMERPLVRALDQAARIAEQDRSKFIRSAIREKISRDSGSALAGLAE